MFNHAQFYGPAAVNGNISSANFGPVVSAAAPRLVQLAAKFSFYGGDFHLRREDVFASLALNGSLSRPGCWRKVVILAETIG